MMVASTMVPAEMRMTLLFRYRFTVSRIFAVQLILLEKMTEVQDGGLVGNGGAAKIDSGKAAQHGRLVERILGARIGEVEPMLQKVDAQHDR